MRFGRQRIWDEERERCNGEVRVYSQEKKGLRRGKGKGGIGERNGERE